MLKRNFICMIYTGRHPNTWHGFPEFAIAIQEAERHCKKHPFSYGVYQIFIDGQLVKFGFPSAETYGLVHWVSAI